MEYRVRILPAQHELEVEMRLTGPAANGPMRLAIPTWVPGDYSFVKYGRDLFDLEAEETRTGRALKVTREGWQAFQVEGARGAVTVRYKACASSTELAEASGIVDSEYAVLLGTRYLHNPAYLGPCRVTYHRLPPGWRVHHPAGARRIRRTTAWDYPSFKVLLDSPVVFGKFERLRRRVKGRNFYFVFVDQGEGYASEVKGFVKRLVDVARKFHEIFRSFPFRNYTFVLSLNPVNDWGLEHLTSATCGLGPDVFTVEEKTVAGVRVCAHELFHAWNVRRLRPSPLGRLAQNLSDGSFTEGLWVAEGFTRYYEFLVCTRTSVYTPEQFFSAIVGYHRYLTVQPAYRRVSAVDSSLATYLNHAKYSGRVNSSIDYYSKGMLIAFELDAVLRMDPRDYSLDWAFKKFYECYADRGQGDPGYTTQDVLTFFVRIRRGLGRRLAHAVQQPGGLTTPYRLRRLGFRVRMEKAYYLGLLFRDGSAPTISDVLDTSPAGKSGIAPEDVLTRVNGVQFSFEALQWAATRKFPVTLEVRRGHRTLTFTMTPVQRDQIGALFWRGTNAQARRIARWLDQKFEPKRGQEFKLDFYENFHGIETVV